MNLTLTLDIGNSHPHVGWFINGELKQVTRLDQLTESNIDATGARKVSAITSKVGGDLELSWLKPHEVTSWRTFKDFLGMPFKYAGTLGADRLVQIFYLHQKQAGLQVLIDAGTFTTIDFLDEQGHQGGIIIPGLSTYLEIFKRKGAKLPQLNDDQVDFAKPANIFALNTYDAISEGYKVFIEGAIQKIADFKPQSIHLTGGHGLKLKPLFTGAEVTPHLIHHALFYCLQSAQQQGIA